MIVAIGGGSDGHARGEGDAPMVSAAEAEAFANQRGGLFAQVSPKTGHGVCDAIGALVQRAHGARGEYRMGQDGEPKRYQRAQMLKAMFSPS